MGYATGAMLFFQLFSQNRVKEAKEVCERVISESPDLYLRNFARRNLCELYFHHIGDGPAIREVALAALKELDAKPNELKHPRFKRLYGDLCDYMRDVSISFEEYKKYKLKKWEYIRPSKDEEKSLQTTEEDIKRKGVPWLEQLMYHAGDYWQHNAFAQNAVCLSLVLAYRKELKLGKEDINLYTLPFYSMAIVNIISNHINTCRDKGQAVNFDNYFFIGDRAIEKIEACKESKITDESVADEAINIIKELLAKLTLSYAMQKTNGQLGTVPHPTVQEINDEFNKTDSGKGGGGRRPPIGCLLPFILVALTIITLVSVSIASKGTEEAPLLTSYSQLVNNEKVTINTKITATDFYIKGDYIAEENSLTIVLYKLYYIELDGKIVPIVYFNQFGKTPKATMIGRVLGINERPGVTEEIDKLCETLPDAVFGDYVVIINPGGK